MPSDISPVAISPFLELPVEVRLEIYRHLLSSKYIKRKIPYESYKAGRFETVHYTYPFHKEVLRTNRMIYQEAVYIFHKENLFVRFTSLHSRVWHLLWRSQTSLLIALGDDASQFRRCAMDVYHHCLEDGLVTGCYGGCGCTKVESNTALLVIEQLPDLLRTLRAYSQQGIQNLAASSFSINVLDNGYEWCTGTQLGLVPVPPRDRILLEPFKVLYHVQNLIINGMVEKHYKLSVESSATQREPTVAEIVTAASAIRERGDDAFFKGQFDLALSLYTSAIRDFQVNRRRGEYTGVMTTGELAGINIGHAVRLLKIVLHDRLAAALVKVKEYQKAVLHAKVSAQHIVTPEEPAEEWAGLHRYGVKNAFPFFWGGLAYEGLGDLNRAIYGVGEAMAHSRGDKTIVKEYLRLEAEIEKQGVVQKYHEFGKGTNWWIG